MTESKYLRFALRLGSVLLAAAAVWFAFAYVLPWLLPFILAMLTARVIEPGVLFMFRRCGFQRSFSAAVFTVLIVSFLLVFFALISGILLGKMIEIIKELPGYLSGLPTLVNALYDRLQALVSSVSPEMRGFVESAVEGMSRQLSVLPAELSARLVRFLSSCASFAPGVIMFIFTYAIGTFFISSSYQRVNKFLIRQFPEQWQDKIRHMKSDMFGTLGGWLKAELFLMAVTFLELLIAFGLLRVRSPLSAALTVAFIDALPVLGTGTVLIPWALILLVGGSFGRGAAVAVTWGVITLVRSFLEPKILGDNVGLHPAATLLAIYLGYSVMSVKGMLLFPLTLIILKQFNDKGYIKLWKN